MPARPVKKPLQEQPQPPRPALLPPRVQWLENPAAPRLPAQVASQAPAVLAPAARLAPAVPPAPAVRLAPAPLAPAVGLDLEAPRVRVAPARVPAMGRVRVKVRPAVPRPNLLVQPAPKPAVPGPAVPDLPVPPSPAPLPPVQAAVVAAMAVVRAAEPRPETDRVPLPNHPPRAADHVAPAPQASPAPALPARVGPKNRRVNPPR